MRGFAIRFSQQKRRDEYELSINCHRLSYRDKDAPPGSSLTRW